jgi:crossover junction endodeoxyribonuclease RuvC
MSARVIGLDLSLASTGMAVADASGAQAWSLRPPRGKDRGHDRLCWILDAVWQRFWEYSTADGLVVVEGPSYSSVGGQQHERAGLWWMVTHRLWLGGVRYAVVPPAVLKKYATGKGNAGKDEMMLATARRFPDFDGGNDAADALWLAAAGADHLGHPPVVMPATHRAALAKVDWPVA